MHQVHSERIQASHPVSAAGIASITVTWRVDAAALARAMRTAPATEPAASGNGTNGKAPRRLEQRDAQLAIAVHREAGAGDADCAAEVLAHLPGRSRPVRLAAAQAAETTWRRDGDWLHVDISTGDWSCALSLRPQREQPLAYARTDLFQRLGIAGGRYEPVQADLARAGDAALPQRSADSPKSPPTEGLAVCSQERGRRSRSRCSPSAD